MKGRETLVAFLAGTLLVLGLVMPASATTLTVDTGSSLVLDPATSLSGTFTLSATNDSGSVISSFNAWGLILQLVPQPGAIGTATFVNLTEPSVNPSLGSASTPPTVASTLFDDVYSLLSPMNGTTAAYQVGIANDTTSATTWALGQTYNLADLTVQLSAGAQGSWTVFAINDENNTSNWMAPNGSIVAFSNVPTAPSTEVPYTSVQIGSITAVPEPSSLMLAASAIVASGWFGWRSRRQPAVVEA